MKIVKKIRISQIFFSEMLDLRHVIQIIPQFSDVQRFLGARGQLPDCIPLRLKWGGAYRA